MVEILDFFKDFNIWTALIRLALAAVMGGLIGAERGKHGRAAGMRTHILICIGASLTSLTGLYISEELKLGGDVARLTAQVISGIGFLGAGTILIRNGTVITGLTTAAGMWATAAIGVSVGYGFYIGAFLTTVIAIFSMTILSRAESGIKGVLKFYIELSDISETEAVVEFIEEKGEKLVSYDLIPPKSGHKTNIGIICSLSSDVDFSEFKEELSSFGSVLMVVKDINN